MYHFPWGTCGSFSRGNFHKIPDDSEDFYTRRITPESYLPMAFFCTNARKNKWNCMTSPSGKHRGPATSQQQTCKVCSKCFGLIYRGMSPLFLVICINRLCAPKPTTRQQEKNYFEITVKSQKPILANSFMCVANWCPVGLHWAFVHSEQGILYTMFRRLCALIRPFTGQISLAYFAVLRLRGYLGISLDTPGWNRLIGWGYRYWRCCCCFEIVPRA